MRGKMDSLVRELDDLKQIVGQALGPNVANQIARTAQTVKDIAYVEVEPEATDDLIDDSNIEDATITEDEAEAKTHIKSGKDDVTYPVKLPKNWK